MKTRTTRKEKRRRWKIKIKALNRAFLKKRGIESEDRILADETDPLVHEIKVTERIRKRYKQGNCQREHRKSVLGFEDRNYERDIVISPKAIDRWLKESKKKRRPTFRPARPVARKPKRHKAWKPDYIWSDNNFFAKRYVFKRDDDPVQSSKPRPVVKKPKVKLRSLRETLKQCHYTRQQWDELPERTQIILRST